MKYTYIGWFAKDPMDSATTITSYSGYVDASNEEDAFSKAEREVSARAASNKAGELLNWYVKGPKS